MGYYDDDVRADMIGVEVTAWQISADRASMTINGTKDGKDVAYYLETYGDCCSYTWIEGTSEENALIGGVISSVEDLDLPGPANGIDDNQNYDCVDCIAYYGLAIWTNRGKFVLDYRNSSNGYYGGSISISEITVKD